MIFRIDMIPTVMRAAGRFVKRVFGPEMVFATDEVVIERRTRCAGCLWAVDDQCVACGCNIMSKTLLASERCPRLPERWGEQTRFSNGL